MTPLAPALTLPSFRSTAAAWRIPASGKLLWESPFWILLALHSLLPASLLPKIEWFGIPMRPTDLLALTCATFYGTVGLIHNLIRGGLAPGFPFVGATLLLFTYGLLRLWTGPLELEDQLGMTFALLLAAAAPIQAAGVLSVYRGFEVEEFLDRLMGFLACVSLLYTAESVFGLGLRSESGANLTSDFGIERVRGPLFGSSTGYLLLLPAIGWSLRNLFQSRTRGWFATFSTIALLSAYLGLGSRAGLLILILFSTLVLIQVRKLKQSEATGVALAGLCLAAGLLVYAQADTQRLTKFEDTHRRLTHETASNILTAEPIQTLIEGQGYGAIWPWYRRDTLRAEWIAIGDNTVNTGFGPSLYHPHSTLLELVIEFGLPGLLWLGLCAFTLIRTCFDGTPGLSWKLFAFAVLASIASFGFDLFLFKEARVNAVWWLFVVGALHLRRTP